MIHPYLRPPAARDSTRWPQARGIDYLLPSAALAIALATFGEIQRRDDLEDEMEENALACEAHTRLEEEARHQHVCVVGRRQLLEDEDLSDPTSITARQSRTDFRLPYFFFFGLINPLEVTPLHQMSPEKHKNCTVRSGR